MHLDPLSFAALAASGPMWEKEKPPTDWRRCAHCQIVKRRSSFSTGATVCQKCVAENKLRRSKEAKTRYAAKKRQEMRDGIRKQDRADTRVRMLDLDGGAEP